MLKFIIFCELMFSLSVFFRIIGELRTKNLIDRAMMTKIVAGLMVWMAAVSIFFRDSVFFFSVFMWFPGLLMVFLPKILLHMRKRQFRRELPFLLNDMILKMRSGFSFRSAMQSASQNLSEFSRVKVEKMTERLILSVEQERESDEMTTKLFFFLGESDKHPHLAIQRLTLFRDQLRMEDFFRERVSRALRPLYAQSGLMMLMYIGLLGFVTWQFGWREHSRTILLATILFLSGGYLAILLGGRFRWKV